MPGAETARSIAFSVRKLAIQPLNNAGGVSLGVPIVIDTLQSADLKIEVTLEAIRGGAYLFPLGLDPKEMKGELTAKLTDSPPTLITLLTAGAYTKQSVAGVQVDPIQNPAGATQNVIGTSVGTRCTITAVAAPAVNGNYAIVVSAAQVYAVYDLNTGKAAANVTTALGTPTTDTTSVAGVTITTAAGTFTVGDVGNFSIINVGGSGTGESLGETVQGPTGYPVTPPQVRILGDATRRGVLYEFVLYYAELYGIAYPLKQGGYVVPDIKAEIIQPPYLAANAVPWQFRRVS